MSWAYRLLFKSPYRFYDLEQLSLTRADHLYGFHESNPATKYGAPAALGVGWSLSNRALRGLGLGLAGAGARSPMLYLSAPALVRLGRSARP